MHLGLGILLFLSTTVSPVSAVATMRPGNASGNLTTSPSLPQGGREREGERGGEMEDREDIGEGRVRRG